MLLSQKQREFAIDVANLIDWAYRSGYEVTFGECYRSDEQAEINALGLEGRVNLARLVVRAYPGLAASLANNGKNNGIRKSLHTQRLAIDLNLWKDGRYLSDSEAYRPLGVYFKSLRDGNCWGGDFGDGNHFSREHEGHK